MSVTKRRLTKRPEPAYDNKQHGASSSGGGLTDDHSLNEKLCALRLIRPFFKGGPLIFRPFPHPSYRDPTIMQPGRKAPEPGSYTHWHVWTDTAYYIGIGDGPRHTFNLYELASTEQADKLKNPFYVFYRACKQAHKNGEFGSGQAWNAKWNRLMEGDSKGGAAIDAPTRTCYIQAAIYVNGDTEYIGGKGNRVKPYGLAPNDPLPVVQLKSSGGRAMTEVFDKRNPAFDGDEEVNFSAGFLFGDPVGRHLVVKKKIAGGSFVEIYNPDKLKKLFGDHCSWDGKSREGSTNKGYEAAIFKELEVGGYQFIPSLDTEDLETIFGKVQWWFDGGGAQGILRFAPMEQQALWVAEAYGSIPSLLKFAWAEHSEFMTDEVKAVLMKRVSSVVPGAADAPTDDEPPPPRRPAKRQQDPTVTMPDAENEEDAAEGDALPPDDETQPDDSPLPDEQQADAVEEEATETAPQQLRRRAAAPVAHAEDEEDEEEPDDFTPGDEAEASVEEEDATAEIAAEEETAGEYEEDAPEPEPEPEPAPVRRTRPAAAAAVADVDEDPPLHRPEPAARPQPAAQKTAPKPAAKKQTVAAEDEQDDLAPAPAAKQAAKLAVKPAGRSAVKAPSASDGDDKFASSASAATAAKANSQKRGAVSAPPPAAPRSAGVPTAAAPKTAAKAASPKSAAKTAAQPARR